MFRKWQVYMGANDYVEMTENIDSSMLASLGQRRRRRVLTAIVLAIALFVGCAWVASTPVAFQWLSRVAPPVARFLRPSGGSQVENGIRVEVAEVTRNGEELCIHLTMEDLEGERLSSRYSAEWWEYRQKSGASGSCVPYYDKQTKLLHLNLICKPAENMPDFNWNRWVTVTVFDLAAGTGSPWDQVPIPLTLGDDLDLTIWEGLSVTRMAVEEDRLRVFVSDGAQSYNMILSGPHGEQVQMQEHIVQTDGTWWVFNLRDRDLRDCTLTAHVDTTERIKGTWTIQVSPITEE